MITHENVKSYENMEKGRKKGLKLNKCPVCGKPSVTIEGTNHCLYCGRTWDDKVVETPAIKRMVQLNNNQRVMEQAHENLLNNIDGSLDYCKNRGINMHTIEKWKLGYAPKNFRLLPIIYHERVLFPIQSNDGEHVIAFGGRKISYDDERCKYLNSKASLVYNKSESLYGYHLVPDDADTVYLCEGYVDVLSMDAKGFHYPVASLGTALTEEQAVLIRKKAKRVVIAYDADEAGQKNALRAINILARAGFKTAEISILVVSDAKDVDEALQHGCTLCEQSLLGYLLEREKYDLFVDALVNV